MTDHHASTDKPYLKDSYQVEFEASLLGCDARPDGGFDAVLDRSFFYPESGGQRADTGRINGVDVRDVQEDKRGVVHHVLASALQPQKVNCRVDWQKRFDHMQQHTGQHVLSRAFIEVGNLVTVSFHMGDEACTIDLEGDVIGDDVFDAAEALANRVIWDDRKVAIRNVARDRLREESLRKAVPDGVVDVRLVEIEGFDVIGCCGTHVRRTGELGVIKILKTEKVKGLERVSFKVGMRAVEDYKSKHAVLKTLANRFTTSVDAIEDKVDKLQSENQTARKRLGRLSRRLAGFEAKTLLDDAQEHGQTRFVVGVFDEDDADYLRALSGELKKSERTVSLLASRDGSVVCNASTDVAIDLAGVVVARAKALGGTGGGRGGFAAVRLPRSVDLEAFLEATLADLT